MPARPAELSRKIVWKWCLPALAVVILACASLVAVERSRAASTWPQVIAVEELMRRPSDRERDLLRRTTLRFRFRHPGFTEGWQASKGAEFEQARAGMLDLRTKSASEAVWRYLDMDAESITYLVLSMAVSRGRQAEVRWQPADGPKQVCTATFPLRAGDTLHHYEINLARNPGWRGRIAWLAIRPSDRSARVALSDIELAREYTRIADGDMPSDDAAPVAIGEGTRPAAVAPAPSRLRLRLQVPVGRSRLSVGYGVVPEAWDTCPNGVGFVASLEDGTQRRLFEAFLDPVRRAGDRRWFDHEIDLTAFAGGSVTLVFDTLGSDPAVPAAPADNRRAWAAWSAPLLISHDGGQSRPNVVVLLLDDLRADHLHCYGYPRNTSPNIDRLAAGGVRFADAMSQAAWTPPSVASLFTSLYPHEAAPVQTALDPPADALPLPKILAQAGYTTGVVSSTDFVSPALGFARGVRYFDRTLPDAAACARGVASWLDGHAHQPFFLYVHSFDPHAPFQPPPPFRNLFLSGCRTQNKLALSGDPRPGHGGSEEAWRAFTPQDLAYLVALYDADIAYADAQVANILTALERRGLRDHTLIVVLADHGEELLDHGGLTHGRILYQEVLHVPLIIAFPGGRWQGKVVSDLVRTLDVAPTILAATGTPIPKTMRGRSLLATLDGTWRPQVGIGEWADMTGPWRTATALRLCARQGNQKIIRNPDGRWEVYDLAADPREQRNLAADNPPPPHLVALLEQLQASIAQPVSGAKMAMRPEALEAMRALGYLR